MRRKLYFILMAVFVVDGSLFKFDVLAQCFGPRAHTTEMEGHDVAEIKRNLSDQAKKDFQTWDDYFDQVKIGKTTQKELFHRFLHLRIDYPNTIYHPTADSDTYVWDYSLVLPAPPAHSETSASGDTLSGLDPSAHSINQFAMSQPDSISKRSYYSEYKFKISRSTGLVQSKEKGIFFDSIEGGGYNGPCLKPVIYFYPTKEEDVSVRLHYAGDITVSYPHYDSLMKGWNIKAYPDGKIINKSDQEEYSYIFWEGSPLNVHYDLSEGFVVKGEESETFLRETLRKMGLTPREYNEFIVYWFPKLKNNKYNLIHFAHEEYENLAKLEITPKPDSLLRVFMVYKPLTEKIEIKPQSIPRFTRAGFSVVEWGGTELTRD